MTASKKEIQVWQACHLLQQQGINQTQLTAKKIQTALIELGYRKGSLRDIYKYRLSWFEQGKNETNQNQSLLAEQLVSKEKSVILYKEYDIVQLKNENNVIKDNLRQLQERYAGLTDKYHQLLSNYLELQQENQKLNTIENQLNMQRELDQERQLLHEQVVLTYETNIEELKREVSKGRITISKLKQLMENKRHELIAKIDALETDNQKLRLEIEAHHSSV